MHIVLGNTNSVQQFRTDFPFFNNLIHTLDVILCRKKTNSISAEKDKFPYAKHIGKCLFFELNI